MGGLVSCPCSVKDDDGSLLKVKKDVNIDQVANNIQGITSEICQKWMDTRSLEVISCKLYVRPLNGVISSDKSFSGAPSDADKARAASGLFHAFWILRVQSKKEGELDEIQVFLLDRVQEGVRLIHLTSLQSESAVEYAVCMYASDDSDQAVMAERVAAFVKEEAMKDYHLWSNNCIEFARKFGRRFFWGEIWFKTYELFKKEAQRMLMLLTF